MRQCDTDDTHDDGHHDVIPPTVRAAIIMPLIGVMGIRMLQMMAMVMMTLIMMMSMLIKNADESADYDDSDAAD